MSSHSITEAQRQALAMLFDSALEEVRATTDVSLLQECRTVFRKRVPLHLRGYVAALVASKAIGLNKPQEAGNFARRGEPRARNKPPRDRQKPTADRQEPAAADVRKPQLQERRQIEERQNRFQGEGVTLFVSAGRRQRFNARAALKVLLDIPGVQSEAIGDIRTMDNYCFIVVDPDVEQTILSVLDGYDLKGRRLSANRARKKGEALPEGLADTVTDPQ